GRLSGASVLCHLLGSATGVYFATVADLWLRRQMHRATAGTSPGHVGSTLRDPPGSARLTLAVLGAVTGAVTTALLGLAAIYGWTVAAGGMDARPSSTVANLWLAASAAGAAPGSVWGLFVARKLRSPVRNRPSLWVERRCSAQHVVSPTAEYCETCGERLPDLKTGA